MPQDKSGNYALPERDPQSRIQEILAGISQPEPQPGFWMRLLQAIPQAVSVGVSRDPGAALGQQIAEQFQRVQIEKQRRQRLKELGATIEIEDILARSKEGRAEAADIRRGEREATQREKEFKAASKEQRAQLGLQNRFQTARDTFQANETRLRDIRQNQANKDLTKFQAEASRENTFFAEVAKNSIEAIMSGEMDASTAVDLYSRLANKELPNKADIVTMNKAIKSQQAKVQRMALERITAEGRARRENAKTPQQAALEFAYEFSQRTPMIWITDVDNQQKLVKREVDALTQQPALISGQKFIREATPIEVHQYALQNFSQMGGFSQQSGLNIPASQDKIGHAEGLVREAAKSRPFDQIKNDFLKPEIYQQKLNLTKGEADSIIQRIEAETKGQPAPLPGTLDESEAELREIEQEVRSLTGSTPGSGGGPALPRSLSKEDRETLKSLREREVAINARKQKQATVKFIEDRLNQAKQELTTARTQVRKDRLTSEIAELEGRLKVARESASK